MERMLLLKNNGDEEVFGHKEYYNDDYYTVSDLKIKYKMDNEDWDETSEVDESSNWVIDEWMQDTSKKHILHVAVFLVSFLLTFLVILIMFILHNIYKSYKYISKQRDSKPACPLHGSRSSLPSYEHCLTEDGKSLPNYWQIQQKAAVPAVPDTSRVVRCAAVPDTSRVVRQKPISPPRDANYGKSSSPPKPARVVPNPRWNFRRNDVCQPLSNGKPAEFKTFDNFNKRIKLENFQNV